MHPEWSEPETAEDPPPDDDATSHVVERPDGWYWVAIDGRQEFGPFASVGAALADMESAGEGVPEPGETLHEAEAEIGIADWVDPDTGEPAEDTTTHIDDQ